MKLTLYHSPCCLFCVRVLSVLKELPIDIQLNDTGDKKHFQDLYKGGGKTQVPCLKIEDKGTVKWMYESADIIDFLKSI